MPDWFTMLMMSLITFAAVGLVAVALIALLWGDQLCMG